jgi:hypothetical protein
LISTNDDPHIDNNQISIILNSANNETLENPIYRRGKYKTPIHCQFIIKAPIANTIDMTTNSDKPHQNSSVNNNNNSIMMVDMTTRLAVTKPTYYDDGNKILGGWNLWEGPNPFCLSPQMIETTTIVITNNEKNTSTESLPTVPSLRDKSPSCSKIDEKKFDEDDLLLYAFHENNVDKLVSEIKLTEDEIIESTDSTDDDLSFATAPGAAFESFDDISVLTEDSCFNGEVVDELIDPTALNSVTEEEQEQAAEEGKQDVHISNAETISTALSDPTLVNFLVGYCS